MERPNLIVLVTIPGLLECAKNHFPLHLERFCTCQKQLTSYWKKREGLIWNDVNTTDNTEISPIAYAVESPRWTSFITIEKIVARCELWPWSTDRFAIAVCSIDNNNTTVGHLSREFGRFLWHFLTHAGEMNAEGDGVLNTFQADWRFPAT